MRQFARVVVSSIAWVLCAAALAQQKPTPKPSESPAARDSSQAAQLPAGPDSGIPGSAQNAPLGSETTGPVRRGGLLRKRGAPVSPSASDAARPAVNDSAAARMAARKPGAVKPAASAPARP